MRVCNEETMSGTNKLQNSNASSQEVTIAPYSSGSGGYQMALSYGALFEQNHGLVIDQSESKKLSFPHNPFRGCANRALTTV